MGTETDKDGTRGDLDSPEIGEDSPIAELATARESGLTVEILRFVVHTRKWWLAPIIIMMLMVAGLLVLTGTGVAPLIYALF